MNIAFFLTPKSEVIYELPGSTMRQALERMEYHRYTAVPLIDEEGRYVGTLTEGDLLWMLKGMSDFSLKEANKIRIKDIPKRMVNKPVSINADIEDLLTLAANQNFVPVIDDQGVFIGIIKRSDIIQYCHRLIVDKSSKNET
ncbi:CBS domain-containing protein [Anaerosolibacter carboniphilus]|uniref:CBS domain-containing protein n=1 Tax=Anaerosolibacter carboniphilus TaxID=1417629 RepID=A0A841L382_9FIRM|nr:CBS domain-containing protein [Anaerosolibacter carboniphilus]MBB6216805.1 CBS domain-containing protein [Anaerosolibacter carboniphilus]